MNRRRDIHRMPLTPNAVPLMRVLACSLSIILHLFTFSVSAAAQDRPDTPKRSRGKLDSALSALVSALESGEPRQAALGRLHNPLLRDATIPVSIRVDDIGAVTAWLLSSGSTVVNSGDDVIEAYISAEIARDLNSLAGVRRVTQIVPAHERATSQGVTVHNAANWHTNGYSGAGVKVGIIDSFQGFAALMGSELPSTVTARCYSSIGVYSAALGSCQTGSNHGYLRSRSPW